MAAVVLRPGVEITKDELLDHLGHRVIKWWLPDDIVFIDELPKTGTGKFDKKVLRDQFADRVLED